MKKLLFILFCFAALSFNTVKASHVVGAEITYKHITADSFSVKLVVYRDCLGIPLYGAPIKVQSGCGTFNIVLNRDTVIDVTGVGSNCAAKSRCVSGTKLTYPYGFEKHVFSGSFKMPNDTCCNYLFSWTTCCRNNAITTGASAAIYYTETRYNKCLAPRNSSPAAILDPKLLVGLGKAQRISYQAMDTVDNDSVSYELSEPLSDSGVVIPYNSGFSLQKPLTFTGFPNFSLPAPLGFNLDPSTGEIYFRPLIKNEVTVFAIKAIEWRKINGKYEKIGEVIRDVQMWVVTDTVPAPEIDRVQSKIGLCSSLGTHCQIIPVLPGDPSDSITISYIANTPNITIKNIGVKASHPIAEVCIVVDSALLKSSVQPKFFLQAISHSCPIQKVASKEFYFETKPQLPDSFEINLSLSKCRNATAKFTNKSSLDSLTTVWQLWNANDTFRSIGDTITNNSFNDSGWVYASVRVFSPKHCNSREYKDSIYIGSDRFLDISLGNDRTFCFKQIDTLQLSDTILKGIVPYSFQWSTNNGDTNSRTIYSLITGKRNVSVKVTDANGCISTDTIVVSNHRPQVSINSPTNVCANSGFGTTAVITNATNPVYSWVGFTNNNPFLVDTPTASRSYQFILEDEFGCKIDTSISINVIAPTVNITGKTSYCTYDTILLKSNTGGGLSPITTTWQPNGFVGDSLLVYPNHSAGTIKITAKIKDGFGCENTATETIIVNALPIINFTSTGPFCNVNNNINLSSKAAPSGGVWSGQGVINDSIFSPQNANIGTNSISYYYKDNTSGCYNVDTTSIVVVKQPQADFFALSTTAFINDTIAFINTTPNNSSLQNRWNMGDAGKTNNIQTTNNAFFSYADTGRYTITLWTKSTNCPADSVVKTNYIIITKKPSVGLAELGGTSIKLYPNPAKDRLTIEAEYELVSITLTDVLGRKYEVDKFAKSTKIEIEVSSLSAGSYFIEAKDVKGNIYTSKVQISR